MCIRDRFLGRCAFSLVRCTYMCSFIGGGGLALTDLWTLPTLDLFAIDDRDPQGDHPEDDKNDKDGSDDNSRIHAAILSGRGKTSPK